MRAIVYKDYITGKCIPADIYVLEDGTLDIGKPGFIRIRDKLYFQGNLDLNGSEIRELPKDFNVVMGNLNLANTKRLKQLPENLEVHGFINLRDSNIESIPSSLISHGNLILDNTSKLHTLPDCLTVGGGLSLKGSRIKTLPMNLFIGGVVDISNTEYLHMIPKMLVSRNIIECDDDEEF